MISTLPMYDWPQVSVHIDALWASIRDQIRARGHPAPDHLSRGGSLWNYWQNPGLILGQTCGAPYRTRLHGQVTLLGAFDQALPGAPPGYYYSNLVVHRDAPGQVVDFVEKTFAYNGIDSQSGYCSAQNHVGKLGLRFRRTLHTGAHIDSARAIARGEADIAAIDAQTWRFIDRYEPGAARQLRILEATEPTPGLPLISAAGADATLLREAIIAGLETVGHAHREALDIAGFVPLPADAYLSVATPEPPSQDAATR